MAKATYNGINHGAYLTPINNCYVEIPSKDGAKRITVNALPDISDSKTATYTDENVAGRSSPYKVYGYSSVRAISFTFHFYAVDPKDFKTNLDNLRALASCAYPRDAEEGGELPYNPPTVCKLKCGKLLADNELCVILISYNVKFPTDVAWDEYSCVPYRFDVDTSWEVVYSSINLPGADKIIKSGG